MLASLAALFMAAEQDVVTAHGVLSYRYASRLHHYIMTDHAHIKSGTKGRLEFTM